LILGQLLTAAAAHMLLTAAAHIDIKSRHLLAVKFEGYIDAKVAGDRVAGWMAGWQSNTVPQLFLLHLRCKMRHFLCCNFLMNPVLFT
jgi:hypothetical protein